MDAIVKKKKTKGRSNRIAKQDGSDSNNSVVELKLLLDFNSATPEVDNLSTVEIVKVDNFDTLLAEAKQSLPVPYPTDDDEWEQYGTLAPNLQSSINSEFYDNVLNYYKEHGTLPIVLFKVYTWGSEYPDSIVETITYGIIKINKTNNNQGGLRYNCIVRADVPDLGGFIQVHVFSVNENFEILSQSNKVNIYKLDN